MLLTCVVGAIRISTVSARRWKSFNSRQTVLLNRIRSASGERAPLLGNPTRGNAWDDYLAPLGALASLTEPERQAIAEAARAPVPGATPPKPGNLALASEVLARMRPHLDDLREAGRREVATYVVEWQEGASLQLPWVRPCRTAAMLFALSARERRAAGNWEGAWEDLAAGLQLAGDNARVPILIHFLISNAMSESLFDELYLALQDPALTPEMAARFEDLLARAEERVPPAADVLDAERAFVNVVMGEAERTGSLGEIPVRGGRAMLWRQGFSMRIAAADLDEKYEAAAAAMRVMQDRPWAEANSAYERVMPANGSENPLEDFLMITIASVDRAARETRGRSRLLRTAFAALAGHDDPGLRDPFEGLPLGRRVEDTKSVLWVRWTDGDQAGQGAWKLSPGGGAADIVLEVPR